ncbi:hypothetical protein FNV43_RR26225 [Rhamnella rubrinervis]|uniref:Uncharacterized protein n=1 Tax=Rhamnella rubrinervis TaxID=2594499 RepID=A0A8K0DNW4_9ROSA|nr:hypothetical protein FNV43_RR26225 [Rhamnella rubrinervis]
MGRSPCCSKVGLKKGPWTPEEDQKLLAYIEQHGHGSWRALPANAGLQRCGKSCRLRWTNYLRPDIKRGKFSLQEEQTIIQLHALLGNRWSAIASHLPKRTDNEIKNHWNTHLKKRLTKMGIDPMTHKPKLDALGSGAGNAKDAANLNHMAQWESARLEAEGRLVRESKLVLVSNPLQHQLGFFGTSRSTTTQLTYNNSTSTAPPPLPCLDVLKAWKRTWTKSTRGNYNSYVNAFSDVMAMDDLESPTSTLNFSDNSFPIQDVAGFDYNTLGALGFNKSPVLTCETSIFKEPEPEERLENSMDLQEMSYGCTDGNAWFVDSFRTSGNDQNVNVTEGLADMFVYNGGDQKSLLAVESCDNGGGGGGSFELENKSYWNGTMNLVNASSSGLPPVF